jgi:competence protein ComEA
MSKFIRTLVAATFAVCAWQAHAAVDANRANPSELESVKGIGPGLATKIAHGRPYKDWSDLIERVPGVGAGNAARFSQNGLTVGGASFNGAGAATKPVVAKGGKPAAEAPQAAPKSPAPTPATAAKS